MITRYQLDVYEMHMGIRTGEKMTFSKIGILLDRKTGAISSTFSIAKGKIESGEAELVSLPRARRRPRIDGKLSESNAVEYSAPPTSPYAIKRDVRMGVRCRGCYLLFTPRTDCSPEKCMARENTMEQLNGLGRLFHAIDNPEEYNSFPRKSKVDAMVSEETE